VNVHTSIQVGDKLYKGEDDQQDHRIERCLIVYSSNIVKRQPITTQHYSQHVILKLESGNNQRTRQLLEGVKGKAKGGRGKDLAGEGLGRLGVEKDGA
jgi:hypothetical protein